jgi:hypothetical protein
MTIKNSKLKLAAIVGNSALFFSFFSPAAHAELSVAAMAGLADYTTVMRGDAIYNFQGSNQYYIYPGDYNSKDFAGGLMVRYLYCFNPKVSLGIESGYIYIDEDVSRIYVNDILPNPFDVESFATKSHGLILLNAVFRYVVAPNTSLAIYGGPAWLNTKYIADDFHDGVTRKTENSFEPTAAAGAEVDWSLMQNWQAGLRFDYVFNTDKRTVATTGSTGGPLNFNKTAKSGLTMYTFSLRYIIPGT